MLCVVEGWRMKCLCPEGICLLGEALKQARVGMQQGGAQSEVPGEGLTREHGLSGAVTCRGFREEVALELLGARGWLRL